MATFEPARPRIRADALLTPAERSVAGTSALFCVVVYYCMTYMKAVRGEWGHIHGTPSSEATRSQRAYPCRE